LLEPFRLSVRLGDSNIDPSSSIRKFFSTDLVGFACKRSPNEMAGAHGRGRTGDERVLTFAEQITWKFGNGTLEVEFRRSAGGKSLTINNFEGGLSLES